MPSYPRRCNAAAWGRPVRTRVCACVSEPVNGFTHIDRGPISTAAFHWQAEETPAPDPREFTHTNHTAHPPFWAAPREPRGAPFYCQGFFFPPYIYCNAVHSSQRVCVRVWYEVLEGISWDDRVSLSGFDKHSYILRNSLTCCRGHRPSCLFPVKLLICKQTQCLRWCLELKKICPEKERINKTLWGHAHSDFKLGKRNCLSSVSLTDEVRLRHFNWSGFPLSFPTIEKQSFLNCLGMFLQKKGHMAFVISLRWFRY